ncbi:cobalamin biosynthesis protein [Candidatus Nitrosopumilus sediminis]|uniref:Probable cobalamin biosynthesis protein CobD n=1 Tax=Candidatus Nitrosopumilus sediminis TaxID=1229909 RepID=K0BAE8_9ARCH|nr:cobalamin biosynthesis protein [Candidatus Nitrosopumilus sediminis]AFS81930.1 cobalamin biosynthesis protein CobD [Candidatus Nitrosopumilus sediminis]
MIIESLLIIGIALLLDFKFGDPKNKYHPTAWIGSFLAKLIPITKNKNSTIEKFGGACVVIITLFMVILLLLALNIGISLITVDYVSLIVSVIVGALLLKSTIAIHGMEKHARSVIESIDEKNLDMARNNLSMIVKRNTTNLDKDHILSGVLESISENTVDGITGPMFYYALFGLPGAFAYRVINTADSMIGYKTDIFKNVGWFAATCDSILNYIPSRLTGLIMIISAAILQNNWKESYKIMIRDGKKTESPNAGYPMAALAGALETKFEKINHYKLGDGETMLTKEHVHSAIAIMKLTSLLFFGIITIPIICVLTLLGWWVHA